jgi:hypothetical protein
VTNIAHAGRGGEETEYNKRANGTRELNLGWVLGGLEACRFQRGCSVQPLA